MKFKSGDVRRSLRKKGFKENSNGHHIRLSFYRDGKVTRLYTYVSHGSGSETLGPGIVSAMKDQLGLSSNKEVKRLVDCAMAEDEYLAALIRAGKLSA